jgi:hypothetical protein
MARPLLPGSSPLWMAALFHLPVATNSQAGSPFMPSSKPSLHRLTFNWQLSLTLFFRLLYRTDFVTPIVFLITPQHGLHKQHCLFSYANRFCRNVFTRPFPSSCCLFLLIKNLLPSNGHHSIVCFVVIA